PIAEGLKWEFPRSFGLTLDSSSLFSVNAD
ncbi:MAG: hypothetical protein ACI9MB_000530, partial [Verrucomicrobiales bacterium]